MRTMMMMKNPVTVATCLLLFSSLAVLVKEISGSNSPTECCFGFYSNPLPKSRVVSFQKTDHQCPKEGVLLTTKKGDKVCVDPSQQWVKNIIKLKEKVQAKPVDNPTTSKHQPNTTHQAQQSPQ
ncbi:C-C motif chemokine 4-like [Nematolebias whitei]|uniref:C-C motif chemokine 4-like n=1 Tax=Nematolebias whitei TaxID=451745 RepID=UPI00189A0923|nr:C-C motif chemokine 4-like [Nematolebias whitei]